MPNALLKLGIAMILAGVATESYYLYCTQFGGAQIGKYPVSGSADRWTLSDGSSQKFPGGRATKPFSVDLDPAMNPVGINWRATVSGSVVEKTSTGYDVWLFLAGRPVMHESFSISRKKDDANSWWTWKSVGRFDVPRPGRYDVVLQRNGESQIEVRDVRIELRRNLVVPELWLLIAGGVVFWSGILLTLAMLARGQEGAGRFVTVFGVVTAAAATVVFMPAYLENRSPDDSPFAFEAPSAAAAAQRAAAELARLPPSVPAPPVDRGEIVILKADPAVGRIGNVVTLHGTNFGHRQNHGVFIGGHGMKVPLEIVEWSPDVIKARIPSDPRLQSGAYHYRVERLESHESSNLFMFAFAR